MYKPTTICCMLTSCHGLTEAGTETGGEERNKQEVGGTNHSPHLLLIKRDRRFTSDENAR